MEKNAKKTVKKSMRKSVLTRREFLKVAGPGQRVRPCSELLGATA
jgi:hypothetical protein